MEFQKQKKFDIVLFDLGSTLIYFEGDWQEVAQRSIQNLTNCLLKTGFDLKPQEFASQFNERIRQYYIERDKEFIEYTTELVLRNLLSDLGYFDLDTTVLRPALDAMYSTSESHWHLEPEAVPMLALLTQQGYHIGMVSNAADAYNVHRLIDKCGFRHYFEEILISASIGIRKPHPRIFQLALNHWEAHPSQAVMVGDTLSADILGARKVGIASVWINRWAGDPNNRVYEDAIMPDATIQCLSELPDCLMNWE